VNDFLTTILPTEGHYCTVGIRAGKIKQSFHRTIEDVDEVGIGLNSQGVDAYFALASFKLMSKREADNSLFLRSFFLDLDCGEGKPYADQPEAAQALNAFLQATNLPSPTVVNSGNGLHVYWPLDTNVPSDIWYGYAKALKQLCKQHNLYADPAVTTDRARILRIPGTNNYKNDQARPVQIMHQGLVTPFEVFTAALPQPAMDLSFAKQFGMDETSNDIAGGEYPKSSFTKIVKRSMGETGCAQIKNALVNAATLEEPLWRAALSIAVRCEDGAKAIHKISKAHPSYTVEDTEAKAAETKGPYTCQWYRENYSEGCKGCKHLVSSPIALGRIVEETVPDNDTYIIEKPADEVTPAITLSIPAYPFPYFRGANGGVYRKVQDKDGNEDQVEIYPQDLYLTERFFDLDEHGTGEGELVGINLHMKMDGVRRFYAPVTSLFSPEKLRDTLVKNGVVVYGKEINTLMAYFASSIKKLQDKYAANRTRSQMGWTPDMSGFVIGEIEYTPSTTKLAPPTSTTRQFAGLFKPRGTLEEWKKIVNFYNRPELESHALAFFTGFGSPLLRLMDIKTIRGMQLHLKFNGSGSGKSTAQMVINSIFGEPDTLLMKQDDTMNSKMQMLGMMNSLCFTIDEITNDTSENLSSMSYGFSSGRGKHRMDNQSNKLRENKTTWCNFTVTSGNHSVVDALQQIKSTADGELRRVLELTLRQYRGATKQEIDQVFNKLSDNYGVAGPIFIQHVLANMDSIRTALFDMQQKIDKELDIDQTDRYFSVYLACCFVGALIAQKLGLHEIDIPRVYKYATNEVQRARAHTKASVGDLNIVAQETLAAFVNENINNVLVIAKSTGSVPQAPIISPRGELKMRYCPTTKELTIPAAELRNFFSRKQVDVRESVLLMTKSGLLKHEGRSVPVRIGSGALGGLGGIQVRCYVFDGDALGFKESAFIPEKPEEKAEPELDI